VFKNICYLTPSDRRDRIVAPKVYNRAFGFKSAKEFRRGSDERSKSREAALRLVKAPQCPTLDSLIDIEIIKNKFAQSQKKSAAICDLYKKNGELSDVERLLLLEHEKELNIVEVDVRPVITPHHVRGMKTVVEYREWSDEYRVRTSVECSSGSVPEPKSGPRYSTRLSKTGAKKLSDSAAYMDKKRGGYKTFITGTFAPEIRKKIALGKTSIAKEVSRTMDAINKIYQRGFVDLETGKKYESFGEGALAYCWVAENPKNKEGEDNPHVHMLLDWRVKKSEFNVWAKRLEDVWGNGTFHIEKIKKTESAGAYLLKAVGYMTKGYAQDQGIIRGNRYGISRTARAPLFKLYGEGRLHSMGQLISECYEHVTEKYGNLFSNRKKLLEELERKKKTKESARGVGKALENVRNEIKNLPIVSTKYQVILKGWAAAMSFFAWAKGENVVAEWLPEKLTGELIWNEGKRQGADENMYFTELKRRMKILREKRRHLTDCVLSKITEYVYNLKESLYFNNMGAYSEYENTLNRA
jgi:hypothetical protein